MLRQNIDQLTSAFEWEWKGYVYSLLLVLDCMLIHVLWIGCDW